MILEELNLNSTGSSRVASSKTSREVLIAVHSSSKEALKNKISEVLFLFCKFIEFSDFIEEICDKLYSTTIECLER